MSASQANGRPPHSTCDQVNGSEPRKRRKRAPAAGAADDCFTCSTRGAACDRRRPYCSSCLDDGRDCSGYKTQLTWGVGVASRGKLRGLSLPVAGTKRVAGPVTKDKPKKRQPSAGAHVQNASKGAPLISPSSARKVNGHEQPRYPTPKPQASPRDIEFGHSAYSQISFAKGEETTRDERVPSTMPYDHAHRDSVDRLDQQTDAAAPTNDQTHDMPVMVRSILSPGYGTETSLGTFYSETPAPDSLHDTQPMEMFHGYTHVMASYDDPFHPGPFLGYPQADESFVRGDAYASHTTKQYSDIHDPSLQPLPGIIKHEDDDEVVELAQNGRDDDCAIIDDVSVYSAPLSLDFSSLPMSPSFSLARGIGKTPRIQFLINYYAEVISPVIVAFDGPNNPYRTQILRLAAQSDTLQHAISALAASNLRQRRESGVLSTGKTDPARRSSMAHLTLTDEEWQTTGLLSPQDQAREEIFHKNYAVKSLNQQLADPVARKNDSILAILLILCLFHICDSGVAKFQTQFAGVKKLLSLRGNDLSVTAPETKWFTRMFTWFDAMTASVNEREGELQGPHLDISALSDEEWSLENLAGCDGALFRTIAKLGRLNVLSQGKFVEASPMLVSKPLPPMPFTNGDYSSFDGNGWVRMAADEDVFNAHTMEPDAQEQFWREWREIRQLLQMWQLNPAMINGENSTAPDLSPDQRADLVNISESFRYAALLYTERLANPTAASSDSNIAAWVQKGLHFIRQVKSDVYLLWPLFIVGSECVEEADINVIRTRCLDIQKDSGFLNNKSTLDLLEKIWLKQEHGHHGFRFRKVMDLEKNEGEYIVV